MKIAPFSSLGEILHYTDPQARTTQIEKPAVLYEFILESQFFFFFLTK